MACAKIKSLGRGTWTQQLTNKEYRTAGTNLVTKLNLWKGAHRFTCVTRDNNIRFDEKLPLLLNVCEANLVFVENVKHAR